MVKLPLLALVLSAAAAHAQVLAPSAGARAWSGPVAGAVSAAGLDRVAELGTVSLPRLATPGADGRIPLISSPELLNPIAAALAAAGRTPEAFAAMPSSEKLKVLAEAARTAEAGLAARAADLAEQTRSGVKKSRARGLDASAAEARALSAYLDEAAATRLAEAEKALAEFKAAREEAVRSFLEDLPAKIAAGAFEGGSLLARDESDGAPAWRTADGAPDETFDSPQAALDARMAALDRMPPGPWTVAEAGLLTDALRFYRRAGVLADEAWFDGALARLSAAREKGEAASRAGKLGRAAAGYDAGRMNGAEIGAVEKFYERAAEYRPFDAGSDAVRIQARVLATIHTGGAGLPGWEDLRLAKREFVSRMNRLAIYAGLGWIALMIPTAIASSLSAFAALSGLGSFGLFLAMMSPMAVFCWAIWQRDSQSSWPGSYLSELMNRRF